MRQIYYLLLAFLAFVEKKEEADALLISLFTYLWEIIIFRQSFNEWK